MANDADIEPDKIRPANDNQGPGAEPDDRTSQRLDRVALTLARIIGRRIARDQFEARSAANDNRPRASEDGAADE